MPADLDSVERISIKGKHWSFLCMQAQFITSGILGGKFLHSWDSGTDDSPTSWDVYCSCAYLLYLIFPVCVLMPWTDPHWGFSLFYWWHFKSANTGAKFHSHARSCHFWHLSTNKVKHNRLADTVSQTPEFTDLPSRWPADHRRVQSPDPLWFPLTGQGEYITTSCLHFSLEAKESDGDCRKNASIQQGARTAACF